MSADHNRRPRARDPGGNTQPAPRVHAERGHRGGGMSGMSGQTGGQGLRPPGEKEEEENDGQGREGQGERRPKALSQGPGKGPAGKGPPPVRESSRRQRGENRPEKTEGASNVERMYYYTLDGATGEHHGPNGPLAVPGAGGRTQGGRPDRGGGGALGHRGPRGPGQDPLHGPDGERGGTVRVPDRRAAPRGETDRRVLPVPGQRDPLPRTHRPGTQRIF